MYFYPTLPSPNFDYLLLVLKESRDLSFNRSGGGISPSSPKTTPLLLDLHEQDHGKQVFSIRDMDSISLNFNSIHNLSRAQEFPLHHYEQLSIPTLYSAATGAFHLMSVSESVKIKPKPKTEDLNFGTLEQMAQKSLN